MRLELDTAAWCGAASARRAGALADGREVVAILERPDAAAPLRHRLEQMNYRTVCAPSWAGCQAMAGGERPLAVVVGDGVEHPLEACASVPDDVPTILVTAERSLAARRDAMRAGAAALIASPFEAAELLDWLEQFGRERAAPSVLIVDDDVWLARVHAEAMTEAGIKTTVVSDAAAALAALEATLPDLVLMDLEMPGTTGIELARLMRQTRRLFSVPIVFLSGAHDERRQMAAARESGGGDFLVKPIAVDKLVELVGLRAHRARALRAMRECDSLTGLFSHRHFHERAAAELARCRQTGIPCALAMIDVDRFKAINDTYGHVAGDQVLRTLGRGLLGQMRAGDVVGRCGGEEFGVLLVGSDAAAARVAIDQVRASFADMVFDDAAARFAATLSAGIAADDGRDLCDLVRAADEALYEAKLGGRDRVVLAK